MFRKLLTPVWLVLVALMLVASAPAGPMHDDYILTAYNVDCSGYDVRATYSGPWALMRVVWEARISIDGGPEQVFSGDQQSWNTSFDLFHLTGTGTHSVELFGTATVYQYKPGHWDRWHWVPPQWDAVAHESLGDHFTNNSCKVNICHRDHGRPAFDEIEIPFVALDVHLEHGDIYPVPETGCPAGYTEDHLPDVVDCEGWTSTAVLYWNGEEVDRQTASGLWEDPYTLEEARGEIALSHDGYETSLVYRVNEPRACLHSLYFSFEADCEGWTVFAVYDNERIEEPMDGGGWTDPSTLEVAESAGEYRGKAWSFSIGEPEACAVAYRTTFLYGYGASPEEDPDCSGWWGIYRLFRDEVLVDTDYQAGAWTNPYATESVTALFQVSEGQYVQTVEQSFVEPDSCLQGHDTNPWFETTCDGYSYGYELDGQRVTTGDGQWKKDTEREKVDVVVVVPSKQSETYPAGTSFGLTIKEPERCVQCKWDSLYPMTVYADYGAPSNYWEGPFGYPACAVVTYDGPASLDRVKMVCSLCPDQIEGGYIFNPSEITNHGWLYEVDCDDEAHRYIYTDGESEWEWEKEWVRHDVFKETGRCAARVEGCSDWIHDVGGVPRYEPSDQSGK